LSKDQIFQWVKGVTEKTLPDYQLSALLMAIYFKGMTIEERGFLTQAMAHSGKMMNYRDIPGHKVDKHSSGGIGDKTSIILVPLMMELGVKVPMVSGRGLGHTGGTTDKLEAIPGF
jgi:thymidine phosphorylase